MSFVEMRLGVFILLIGCKLLAIKSEAIPGHLVSKKQTITLQLGIILAFNLLIRLYL
jgi:hypothetical protein